MNKGINKGTVFIIKFIYYMFKLKCKLKSDNLSTIYSLFTFKHDRSAITGK